MNSLETTAPATRRFQFGVRHLLLAIALISMFCAALALPISRGRAQRRSVLALKKRNAVIFYDYHESDDNALPRGSSPVPPPIRGLLGEDLFHAVSGVSLSIYGHYTDVAYVNDDMLACLASLHSLEFLDLNGQTAITDDGIAHISSLHGIKYLRLSKTAISNDGLRHVAHLGRLESLDLSRTQVDDDGMHYLTGLKRLKWLSLRDTQVGDNAVTSLTKMSSLESLDLCGTRVSVRGVHELKQNLPHCAISVDSANDPNAY